jgi:hypothetical protein
MNKTKKNLKVMQNHKCNGMVLYCFFLNQNHLEIETVSTNISNAVLRGSYFYIKIVSSLFFSRKNVVTFITSLFMVY